MALNAWLIGAFVALVVAASAVFGVAVWLTEIWMVGSDHANEPAWWPPEIAPAARGPYETRVYRKPKLLSKSTVWTGKKWVYADGSECYEQTREWRDTLA